MIGGSIDPGETPTEAARGEALEETALAIEVTDLRGIFGGREFRGTYENGDLVEALIVLFEARNIGGTMRPDGDELDELRLPHKMRQHCCRAYSAACQCRISTKQGDLESGRGRDGRNLRRA